MTTTHDRTYQLDEFPPNRTVNRPEDENNGESTMKTDYSYKRISDPAMVSFLIPTRANPNYLYCICLAQSYFSA